MKNGQICDVVSHKDRVLGVIFDETNEQIRFLPVFDIDSFQSYSLQEIIDKRLTLDDLKTSVVEVHLWDEGETSGAYVAYKEDVIIEVSSYGGDTTGYQIPFNVHHTGNRVKGTFNLTSRTFTED